MYVYIYIYTHIYIYIYTHLGPAPCRGAPCTRGASEVRTSRCTPGLHNKIPAHKIFARVCIAQKSLLPLVAAKIFQGLGPKRRESCNGPGVHMAHVQLGSFLIALSSNCIPS